MRKYVKIFVVFNFKNAGNERFYFAVRDRKQNLNVFCPRKEFSFWRKS